MSRTSEPKTAAAARIALAGREAEYRAAIAECERLREDRDRAVATAAALGVSGMEIADILGVSVGRVSQLYSLRIAREERERR